MLISLDEKKTPSLKSALKLLRERLRSIFAAGKIAGHRDAVLRIEVPVIKMNLLGWLNAQTEDIRIYWSERDGSFTAAGVGSAHTLEWRSSVNNGPLIERMKARLNDTGRLARYYGGICFDVNNMDSQWGNFGPSKFVLPRLEVFSSQGQTVLACNVLITSDILNRHDELDKELSKISADSPPLSKIVGTPSGRKDNPNKEQWAFQVASALDAISKRSYEKIVLARKTSFEFEQPINPYAFIQRLNEENSNCFTFCFQFKNNDVFLGASPETLFSREGKTIMTEAIAGTRPRGQSESEDKRLHDALLKSPKDTAEHKFVVKMLSNVLEKNCTRFEADTRPTLLHLKGGHHLITRFKGVLKKMASDAQLLTALHPTPAVAGSPVQKALISIQNKEGFSRGWYAGPVGYIGLESTKFAVAIRSGLIKDCTLDLYTGAGIVKGSTASDEWDEIEFKLNTFLKVFQDEHQTVS